MSVNAMDSDATSRIAVLECQLAAMNERIAEIQSTLRALSLAIMRLPMGDPAQDEKTRAVLYALHDAQAIMTGKA